MSRFITRLSVEVLDNVDDGRWILTAPLIYQSDTAGQTFTVPAGFQTDLASVPRLPLVFLLAGDTSREASALHDFLYTPPQLVSRAMADSVLREASAVTLVPAWRRWVMWAGVRVFGGSHWREKGA